ncbi:MAG: GMC family oxidoreductase [Actinomycetales bacterium]
MAGSSPSDARFDRVVIGAGTAGSVVAGRLAERVDASVLLVEAGPDYGPHRSESWPADLLDPGSLPTSHDWGITGPAADGRTLAFDRARVVGGCSTHNGCTQSWGWSGDYDRWAASGLSGWAADDLRPHFASATQRMRVRRYESDEVQPFHLAFVDACRAVGIPQVADLDDLDGGIGVDISPVNVADGVRWNASFGYLDPVRDSGHLQIWDRARVHRLLIAAGRVTGVVIEQGSQLRTVECAEVVLCAGVYGTPAILTRSGIADAGILQAQGIEVHADLPGVGANLHDHPALTLEFDGTEQLVRLLQEYRSVHGWLPEEQSLAKLASGSVNGPYDLHLYPWVEPQVDSPTGWAVVVPVALLTPMSRGSLRMSPRGDVLPDHAYLAEASDRQALADGLQVAAALCAGEHLRPLLGRRRNPPQPDEALPHWMARTHSHYWHPAGTAAMGSVEAGGVCDADGRVHGISGLRIADASLFPDVPRATPALPVVVAGERIAAALD